MLKVENYFVNGIADIDPIFNQYTGIKMTKPYFQHETKRGKPLPPGATVYDNGVNFAIFSKKATSIELLLFEKYDAIKPYSVINFSRTFNKNFNFWHVFVKGLKAGTFYAYRIDGSCKPEEGHIFNKNKLIIDPYGKGNTKYFWDSKAACTSEDNLEKSMRSAVIDIRGYDWEGDKPLRRPMNHTIIYELHVGGFTKSPSSKAKHPGTYSGVIEKIPYLKELGITAVELLPVFDFDDVSFLPHCKNKQLRNFWGYNPIGFFAPHSGYCVNADHAQQLNEFRDMVKSLHKAGIEVILDVVFNHTYEGDETGPFYCFKGIDNSVFYHLQSDKSKYSNFSGCGNSLNCNHPIVAKFILDCLKYWVREMHVDGFRFDEASILSRGEESTPLKYPILWQIELSEALGETKIIAEAWDAGGLYQVGEFPGYRWAEWNGRFRDDIRRFVNGEPGLTRSIANRISGSPDMYEKKGGQPTNSINFISAHDGFTLNDLVSYNQKHNEDNGENNNDGGNHNFSWNYGTEGETDNDEIEALRTRQIKNFAVLLLLSKGVPMILAGDETRRTQRGNNNAYCQDNDINYFDWNLLDKNSSLFLFWKTLIQFRKRHTMLHRRSYIEEEIINDRGFSNNFQWHGIKLNQPGFEDSEARVLSFTIGGIDKEEDIHVMINMYWENLNFEIPLLEQRNWHVSIDTSQNSPHDISEICSDIKLSSNEYIVLGRSIVVLISK